MANNKRTERLPINLSKSEKDKFLELKKRMGLNFHGDVLGELIQVWEQNQELNEILKHPSIVAVWEKFSVDNVIGGKQVDAKTIPQLIFTVFNLINEKNK